MKSWKKSLRNFKDFSSLEKSWKIKIFTFQFYAWADSSRTFFIGGGSSYMNAKFTFHWKGRIILNLWYLNGRCKVERTFIGFRSHHDDVYPALESGGFVCEQCSHRLHIKLPSSVTWISTERDFHDSFSLRVGREVAAFLIPIRYHPRCSFMIRLLVPANQHKMQKCVINTNEFCTFHYIKLTRTRIRDVEEMRVLLSEYKRRHLQIFGDILTRSNIYEIAHGQIVWRSTCPCPQKPCKSCEFLAPDFL